MSKLTLFSLLSHRAFSFCVDVRTSLLYDIYLSQYSKRLTLQWLNIMNEITFKKTILFTTIIIVVFLSLTFIPAELYVRYTRSPVDLMAETGRREGANPMKTWAMVDAYSAYRARPGKVKMAPLRVKTVNRHGFISTPDMSVNKERDTLRILYLGGSSTAGLGGNLNLVDQETWPWLATNLVQQQFPERKIEFINGATGGYTSFESYGRLWSRLRFFSPDIIVVNHAWNEMYYFNRVHEITTWRTLPDGEWTLDRLPTARWLKPFFLDHILQYSQLLSRARLRLAKKNKQYVKTGEFSVPKPLASSYDQRGLDVWRTNLQLFRSIAKTLNAELFVMKQPSLISPHTSEEDKKRCRYSAHGFDHHAHVDAFNRIYDVIDDEIDRDRVIDLTSMSGKTDYFVDHIHPTTLGSKTYADMVSKALIHFLASHYQQEVKSTPSIDASL